MEENRPLHYGNTASIRARSSETTSVWLGLHWQRLAIGLLALSWLSMTAPAEAATSCSHDICEVGSGLNPNCDPCVDTICNSPGGDPYCCQTEWDSFCVEKVLDVCHDWQCAAACKHSVCEIGTPLDSTCNACVTQICFEDPTCCTDAWDDTCVQQVKKVCGATCAPGEDRCSNAQPITSGTTFGTLMGSTNDGCETGNDSCRSGDVWYTYTQAIDQQFVVSSCMTENSFGIDTVLSIHTACPGNKNNEIRVNDDYRLGLVPKACDNFPTPHLLDSAFPIGGIYGLQPGQTVVLRVAHHDTSARGNFEVRILPEPEVWLAIASGAGVLGVLARRRAQR